MICVAKISKKNCSMVLPLLLKFIHIILYLLPRCFPSFPPCVQVHLNPKPHWNWTIGPPPNLWENKALRL